MTIERTLIHDFEEEYAPPEMPVLSVTIVGGIAHLEIARYDQTYETETITRLASMAVSVEDLFDAIQIQLRSDVRARAAVERERLAQALTEDEPTPKKRWWR